MKIPGKHKGQANVKNGNMAAFIYGSQKKGKAPHGRPSRRGK